MIRFNSFFILILISILLGQGCAEKSQTPTNFQMTLGAVGSGLGLEGGLILTGTNGLEKFSVGLSPNQIDNFSIELADGNWNFKAIGWLNESSEGLMTGESRCGFATATIEGQDTTVSLSLSQSHCQNTAISAANAVESPSPFKFKTLNLDSCLNHQETLPNDTGICDGTAPKLLPGMSSSIRISFPSLSNFNTSLPSLTSQCYNLDGFASDNLESGRISTTLRLPVGASSGDFPFVIKSYEKKNCQESLFSYPMPDGIAGEQGIDRTVHAGPQMVLAFADNGVGKTGSPFTQYNSCTCTSCTASGELYESETCGDCDNGNYSSTQTQCNADGANWAAGGSSVEQGVDFLPFLDCGPGCYPKTSFTPKNRFLPRDQIRDAIWDFLGSPWLISPDSHSSTGTPTITVTDTSGGQLQFTAPPELGEAAHEIKINITDTGAVTPIVDCKSYGEMDIQYDSGEADPATDIAAEVNDQDCYGIDSEVVASGGMTQDHTALSFAGATTTLTPTERDSGEFNKMRDVVLGPLAAILYQKGIKTKNDLCDPTKDGRYTHQLLSGPSLTIDVAPLDSFQALPQFAPSFPGDFEKVILISFGGFPGEALYYNCASDQGVAGYLTAENNQDNIESRQMFWDTLTPDQEWVEVTTEVIDPSTSDLVVKEYFLFKASGATPDWDAWYMQARPSDSEYSRAVGIKTGTSVRAQFESVTSSDTVNAFRNAAAENDWTTDNTLNTADDAAFLTQEPEDVNANVISPSLSLGGDFSMDSFMYNVVPWSLASAGVGNLCPAGYIPVPGNATLGTSDFCVMKYEAKNDGGGNAVSQAATAPWNNISLTDAKTECQALGPNYDLISNPEWMTIARDVEAQDMNWSGGAVGSGCLFRGNSGNDNVCAYNSAGSAPDFGGGRDPKASLSLSNGKEIWDLAGNDWEWTDWTLGGALTLGPTDCGATFDELPDVACGSLAAADYMPGNPSAQTAAVYNSDFGLGRLFGGTGGAAMRGSNDTLNEISGVFALRLSMGPSDVSTSTGFRCVYRP